MLRKTLKSLAAIGVLSLLPGIAVAAPPTGKWEGVVKTTKKDVGMTIHFYGRNGDVRLAEPFSCNVLATLQSQSSNTMAYRLSVSPNPGSFCDRLLGRDLMVTAKNKGQLHIRFDAPGKLWQVDLRPEPTLGL